MPGVLLGLALQDVYGIGKRMEQRLNRAGIFTVEDLWRASSGRLRRAWGGINGVLFHQMLHGADIQPPSSPFAKSIGHQHVLEPERRTNDGARHFAQHLLTKAAERLRHGGYYCPRLGLHLSWIGDLGGWWDEIGFHETDDSGFLLARLEQLWPRVPLYKPLSVGVVLLGLVPASRHQPDLFTIGSRRHQQLSPLVDLINRRYGRCTMALASSRPRYASSKAMPLSGGCLNAGSFGESRCLYKPNSASRALIVASVAISLNTSDSRCSDAVRP